LFYVSAFDHFHDGKMEHLGKFPVAGIVGRHCHDRSGTVGNQYIVGDVDGDLFAVDGIDGHNAFNLHAGFFFHQFGALKIRLFGCRFLISGNNIHIDDPLGPGVDQGMFGGNDHVGSAK